MEALLCANTHGEDGNCKKGGHLSCKGCFLVLYCGRDCQVQHWDQHKQHCKSPLMKETWKPSWLLDGRTPDFVSVAPRKIFGGNKYLWGNVPALDILNLANNEGDTYDEDLRLLFAASGDLRNVVKTIVSIPSSFKKNVAITLNDKDFDIVARNAIMLLIALAVGNTDEAVDCIIHIWYSALIRESDLHVLRTRVRPLVEAVNEKIANKGPKSILAKTWTYGSRTLRLVLAKEEWAKLLQYFEVPLNLTPQTAHDIRMATTLAAERKDYRDRRYICQVPAHRVGAERYRKDGILSPFGNCRKNFNTPNPTLFQIADSWPLKDSSDPMDGWDMAEVFAKTPKAAASDLYGRLCYYLQGMLKAFLQNLETLGVSFQHFNLDAQELQSHLTEKSFARIEVSNICDGAYLGFPMTLAYLCPLLQKKDANPHATMIMLFMNSVEEEITPFEEQADLKEEIKALKGYLPPPPPMRAAYDPAILKFLAARVLVRDVERYFNRCMKRLKFEECGRVCGMVMKEQNTIVHPWPMGLTKKPGQAGAQEEFNLRLESAHSGNERYVEWKCME